MWAFGSRGHGTPKPFSDLDLALLSPHPLSLSVLAELAHDFDENLLPIKVDLVDFYRASPEFQNIIARKYAPLIDNCGKGAEMLG